MCVLWTSIANFVALVVEGASCVLLTCHIRSMSITETLGCINCHCSAIWILQLFLESI